MTQVGWHARCAPWWGGETRAAARSDDLSTTSGNPALWPVQKKSSGGPELRPGRRVGSGTTGGCRPHPRAPRPPRAWSSSARVPWAVRSSRSCAPPVSLPCGVRRSPRVRRCCRSFISRRIRKRHGHTFPVSRAGRPSSWWYRCRRGSSCPKMCGCVRPSPWRSSASIRRAAGEAGPARCVGASVHRTDPPRVGHPRGRFLISGAAARARSSLVGAPGDTSPCAPGRASCGGVPGGGGRGVCPRGRRRVSGPPAERSLPGPDRRGRRGRGPAGWRTPSRAGGGQPAGRNGNGRGRAGIFGGDLAGGSRDALERGLRAVRAHAARRAPMVSGRALAPRALDEHAVAVPARRLGGAQHDAVFSPC